MALKNLYTDLSSATNVNVAAAANASVNYPFHNNPNFNYGAGSPIFEGVFDQVGLKFGQGKAYDQPNMGFSNEPFIKSPLQNGFADVGITINSTDKFIRGGIDGNTRRLNIDVDRINLFYQSPRGEAFLDKQRILQKLNPKIKDGAFGASNQRTYNEGGNTLAQIAEAGTGLHIKREGILPTSYDGYKDDIKIYRENNSSNRLINLFNKHISPDTTTDFSEETNGGFGSGALSAIDAGLDFIDDVIDIGVDLLGGNTTEELYSFQGGAGSIYGIGTTTLYRYDNTNQGKIVRDIGTKDSVELPHNPTLGRKKQTRKYNKNISEYHVSFPDGVDSLNLESLENNFLQTEYNGEKDFIPFRFEAVNTENPLQSDFIVFRAFLDTFQDNYNASHNEFNYNGRGETFYTYNGFKRNIDVSFKIAAQSKDEMLPLYEKLSYFVSNTAPEYSSIGRMRTPFIKLTVGDWCNKVPGILNSVGLTWQKDYPWQIEGDNILMLPHVLDVNVQFTPIHDFLPEKSVSSQFISTNTSISYPNTEKSATGIVEVGETTFDVDATAQARAGEKINVGGVEYDVLTPTSTQFNTGEISQTYTGNNN